MPGLLLIVTQMADERHAAAVELAACAAALGRPVAFVGPRNSMSGVPPMA